MIRRVAHDQKTPLMKAALNGHAQLARYLIRMGAESTRTDKEGWSPLHNAASKGFLDVASVLIVDGEISCNPQSNTGYTPMSIFE